MTSNGVEIMGGGLGFPEAEGNGLACASMSVRVLSVAAGITMFVFWVRGIQETSSGFTLGVVGLSTAVPLSLAELAITAKKPDDKKCQKIIGSVIALLAAATMYSLGVAGIWSGYTIGWINMGMLIGAAGLGVLLCGTICACICCNPDARRKMGIT